MKISKLETIEFEPGMAFSKLLFVVVHTDEGITGLGETYHVPSACREAVHSVLAPLLLGEDPARIELLWRRVRDNLSRFVGRGAELRALSAVDVALWDIAGKCAHLPVFRLLGGPIDDHVPIYNTCAGPAYGSGPVSRPGYGERGVVGGPYDDFNAFMTHPGDLAQELLDEGVSAMKIWPLDPAARASGGRRISPEDLESALTSLAGIRDAVGDRMEVMVEGHGMWQLGPAIQITRALSQYRVAWIEDLILADNPLALAELRRAGGPPVCGSEYLATRAEFRPVLEAHGVDVVMIDPTWTGGITEGRKVANMAESYGLPVTFHDCTGPVSLLAGVHLALASTNAIYQETVRAYLRLAYRDLVTVVPKVEHGAITPPTLPGIGTELLPGLRDRPGVVVRATAVP